MSKNARVILDNHPELSIIKKYISFSDRDKKSTPEGYSIEELKDFLNELRREKDSLPSRISALEEIDSIKGITTENFYEEFSILKKKSIIKDFLSSKEVEDDEEDINNYLKNINSLKEEEIIFIKDEEFILDKEGAENNDLTKKEKNLKKNYINLKLLLEVYIVSR